MDNQGWLNALLGAGGVAFLGAIFEGLRRLYDGTRSREREAIANIQQWGEDADDRAKRFEVQEDYQRRLAVYWMARAGTLEYLLRREGHDVPDAPAPPRPPDLPLPQEMP